MKSIHTQKGFTLVELAIVMTIIGLLIGGILKGQELMENARVTSTVAQVKSYEAAVTTFRDTFNAIPGDMPLAQNRIAGCTAACNPSAATAGDSVVGLQAWAANWNAQVTNPLNNVAPTTANGETQLFWTHLLKADLIAGITDIPLRTAGVLAWGESHPAARIGGGFVAGNANGAPELGSTGGAGTGITGLVLLIQQAVATNPVGGTGTTGQGVSPMTPARAAQIDRRIDDGRPNSGYVRGYGLQASCYTAAAAEAYAEAVTSKDCGLVMRIQG